MGVTLVPGYRETRQLGAGRSGRVFLATYRATGAYVAIKYLNATLRRDAGFMARYRAEAPRLVELDDPGVVTYYEYVETGGQAAVVTELVDGVPLRTLLAEHGPLAPEAALTLLKGVLLGLAAVHGQGLAHRDVSPSNLLVLADGTGKLTDVGVAVHPEEPGAPAGSPPYMAPELWTSGAAGVGADLYAAACVLFECATGRPPFITPDLATGHPSFTSTDPATRQPPFTTADPTTRQSPFAPAHHDAERADRLPGRTGPRPRRGPLWRVRALRRGDPHRPGGGQRPAGAGGRRHRPALPRDPGRHRPRRDAQRDRYQTTALEHRATRNRPRREARREPRRAAVPCRGPVGGRPLDAGGREWLKGGTRGCCGVTKRALAWLACAR
ncbi:hypothetical protein GCM10009560_60290 [Nonomuraea longicatena]|uniref:non-specific serine/threonine protein kinase n=2 Tax=Nonomuraea longicatena TaxID=83682 RepID=A0ABN1QP15_9ACTN